MATKKICDRCGAEINPASSVTTFGTIGYSALGLAYPVGGAKELCCSCTFWLNKYLNGEAVVPRQEE